MLVHSISHILINQAALDSGYPAASIRERLYVRGQSGDSPAMAGILLYTAAPDSEGTLGGLVRLGRSTDFRQLLANALARTRLCSSDPFCAEHEANVQEDVLHNAACHSCLFVPETSCERGNRYLDRATIIKTISANGIQPFFENP